MPIALRVEFDLQSRPSDIPGLLGITLGFEATTSDADERIAEAVALARAADVAVVVVGTNAKVESEGVDRASLALPGRQDDLVRAVAAANPHTVVIVNSGSPVELPWRDEVSAVLVGYFGGQEFGAAIADDGSPAAVEPGGRLPTTWPAAGRRTCRCWTSPRSTAARVYQEGIHIGYRAWLLNRSHRPTGSGRAGYADIAPLSTPPPRVEPGGDFTVSVEAANRGVRPASRCAGVRGSRPDSAVDRPVRWLVGFAPVRVGARPPPPSTS